MSSSLVVLDTNVLVSALLSKTGSPAKILDKFLRGELSLVYSEDILEEYEDVLHRPKLKIAVDETNTLIRSILLHGIEIWSVPSFMPLPDEDDRCFYDAATTARAYLITGNAKHYPNEPFILSPAGFIDKSLEENRQ
jgi:putative PIN family toxin of toxin-antitoxin system